MTRSSIFSPADILLPSTGDMTKWSVIACDQYTSQPDYWEDAKNFIGKEKSTLHMVFPEVYLGQDDDERIQKINEAMDKHAEIGVFRECHDSFIFVERTMLDGTIRQGLVGKVDLEAYEFSASLQSPIRPTEKTVENRLPPRVRIREHSPLEIPHILALIDDPKNTVFSLICAHVGDYEKVYDFDLYRGTHIRGHLISADKTAPIQEAIDTLLAPYLAQGGAAIPVGDGNHSLATAKVCFEALKKTMPESEWQVHPSRWALVELVNLHQDSMKFEPVHRIVFDTDPSELLAALAAEFPVKGTAFPLRYVTKDEENTLLVGIDDNVLPIALLQKFLDMWLETHDGELDYIHDDDALRHLAKRESSLGIFLPPMKKASLLPTIQKDGVLPRKTFSLGHSCEKRFYLEVRRININGK